MKKRGFPSRVILLALRFNIRFIANPPNNLPIVADIINEDYSQKFNFLAGGTTASPGIVTLIPSATIAPHGVRRTRNRFLAFLPPHLFPKALETCLSLKT